MYVTLLHISESVSDMFLQSVDDPKRGKVEKRLVTGGCDNLVKIWKMR